MTKPIKHQLKPFNKKKKLLSIMAQLRKNSMLWKLSRKKSHKKFSFPRKIFNFIHTEKKNKFQAGLKLQTLQMPPRYF